MHWLIATNAELATAWYWFFNCFHKAEFIIDEAANALAEFITQQLSGKHSERTTSALRGRDRVIMMLFMTPELYFD